MSLAVAVALWCVHGVLLWRNRTRFRLPIALLHGLAAAVPALILAFPGQRPGSANFLPLTAAAGLLVGLAGGKGHRLAPGLWFGNGLLWLLVGLGVLTASLPAAYGLAAQLGVLAIGLLAHARG